VLGAVKVEFEDDPVGLVELRASLAAEQRAEFLGLRAPAHDHGMAEALEGRAFEVALIRHHVEENETAGPLSGVFHHLTASPVPQ
jgi:hypothetical protein